MISANFLRWLVGLFGLFATVFALAALCGPGRIDTVDAQTRYEVARSLVEHGDSVVRDECAWFYVYKGRDGERYAHYRFPQSGLGVAAIWTADATAMAASDAAREMRRHFFFQLTTAFCGAILAITYAMWFRRLGLGPTACLLWAAGGIVCTPSWYYSCTTFDDIMGTSAVVLAIAVAWMTKRRMPLIGALAAGVAMAWAVNCKHPLALFVLPVLGAMYRPEVRWRKQLGPWLVVLVLLVLGCAAWVMYERYKFPPGTVDPDAEYTRLSGPMFTSNPLPGLASFALSPSCGVFFYCPVLWLALRGWWTWRVREPVFCWSIAAASGLFILFFSFLTFFKGEQSWGPRYLTPMFAVWWVFVPAGVAQVRAFTARSLLAAGIIVQLLGLTVDPSRLFLATPIPLDYFKYDPWLTLDPALSHLLQRPREIVEVVSQHDPEPEFAPGPLSTHAGALRDEEAYHAAQLVAASFSAEASNINPAVHAVTTDFMSCQANLRAAPGIYENTARHYHIYSSLRPWWICQQVLPESARPVNIHRTVLLVIALGGFGVVLMRLAVGAAAGQEKSPCLDPFLPCRTIAAS
jgi:hypothetical protein